MISPETPTVCYRMAYYALPSLLDDTRRRFLDLLDDGRPASFFYLVVCETEQIEPDEEAMRSFSTHIGELNPQHRYYIFQYPTPPPVNMMDIDITDIGKMMESFAQSKQVLAPYFSAVIENKENNAIRYFILGQSPDGETTIREVSPSPYCNSNLGPGPEPQLEKFLDALRQIKDDD